jgi:hypothetical protein
MDDWIKLNDSVWTSADITAEVTERAKAREEKLGSLDVSALPLSDSEGLPQPPQDRPYNARLYHHLTLINEMPPPDVGPLLSDSPATRTPWVGKIWQRVRGQFHELILFYVNRAVRQQTQLNNELIGTLNELTRTIEAQQEEIRRLQAELKGQQEDG